VECDEWEGRAQQRDAEVRQVGKETDKKAKHYASCVKPLANTIIKHNWPDLKVESTNSTQGI